MGISNVKLLFYLHSLYCRREVVTCAEVSTSCSLCSGSNSRYFNVTRAFMSYWIKFVMQLVKLKSLIYIHSSSFLTCSLCLSLIIVSLKGESSIQRGRARAPLYIRSCISQFVTSRSSNIKNLFIWKILHRVKLLLLSRRQSQIDLLIESKAVFQFSLIKLWFPQLKQSQMS